MNLEAEFKKQIYWITFLDVYCSMPQDLNYVKELDFSYAKKRENLESEYYSNFTPS